MDPKRRRLELVLVPSTGTAERMAAEAYLLHVTINVLAEYLPPLSSFSALGDHCGRGVAG